MENEKLRFPGVILGWALVLGFHYGQAQSPVLWKSVAEAFPDAPAAYVERSYVLNLRVTGDSLVAYTEVSEDLMHLRDNTESMAHNKVYGSHFSQVTGLESKTLIWDKNRYKENQVSSFKKNSDRDDGIFFDDSYYYTFNFPSVAKHNRTVIKYRQTFPDPRFAGGFIFGTFLPQMKATYTIQATKGVEFHAEVLNDPNNLVRLTKKEQGSTVTYTWTAERLPAILSAEDAPNFRYYVPHLALYIKAYQTKKGRKEVLPDLNALYKWYTEFVAGLNKDPGKDLPVIVETLKKESKSELDLVARVFYWVQDNIQYIAFEEGMRGFIPHSGAYTCEKKYGDCKDMANIIVNMLQLAGIKAYHTWIGTRDLPYSYSKWPTPIVDNHMIATYVSPSGEYYFLDGTSNDTPLGFPSSMIQGKEALIGFSDDKFEIRTVPEISAKQNLMSDSMVLTLDGATLSGRGSFLMRGYLKIFRDAGLVLADEDEVKRRVTSLVTKGNNKFNLISYKIRHARDREAPTQIIYDFTIPDYVQKAGTDLFINLNLDKSYYSDFLSRVTRPIPKEASYRYSDTFHTILEIPEGFVCDELPSDANHNGKYISYDLKYRREGNRIILTRTLYGDFLLVDVSDFDAWNSDIRKLTDCYKETLVLKKK